MLLIAIIISLVIVLYFFANNDNSKPRKKRVEENPTEDLLIKYDPIYAKLQKLIYNKNPSIDKLPELIRKSRQINYGKKLSILHNEYYEHIQVFLDKGKALNPKYLESIEKSLLLIEPFIIYEKKQYKSFDIKGIPALRDGLIYYSVLGKTDEVRNILELVSFFPELEPFKEEALKALRYCELLPEVLNAIREKNGVKINDLKEQFGSDYELIKSRMYYLTKFGVIKKSKIGKVNIYQID